MSAGILAKLIVVATAAFLLFVGVGRWVFTQACHGSTKFGEVMQRLAHAVHSAFASVFGGIKRLLAAIFSWETLFWFLAAGGLLTWAVAQNHPGQIPGWIDEMDLERTFHSPRLLITLIPILFVLIAIGRMQGVRWHSRQMGVVGLLLAAGGLILLTRWARSEMRSPEPIAIAEMQRLAVDEEQPWMAPIQSTLQGSNEELVQIDSAVQILSPMEGTGSSTTEEPRAANTPEPASAGETTEAPPTDVVVEVTDTDTTEESPASIQVLDPVETPASTESPAVAESNENQPAEELETVKIEVLDSSGQSRVVDHLPAWVEAARSSNNLRTIAVDTQWRTSILAFWQEAAQRTPNKTTQEARPEPIGTMLYGEVATLSERQIEGEYIATVKHVGTIDEGTVFARFAAERLAYDRLHQYYPDTRTWGWSPRTSMMHQNFIIEQCIETAMLHVGEFEEPVYTVHSRIVVHESQDIATYNQTKIYEQRRRLFMAAQGVAGLAWLFMVVSAYLRINLTTGGRHRNWLRAGGLVCALLPFVAFAHYV